MQRRTTKLDQGFSGRTLTAVGVRSSSVDSSHPKHGGKINATHALYFLLCINLVCIVFLIGIILQTLKTSASNRKTTTGSGSSSSTIKWCKESSLIVRNVNITSSIATEITNYNSTASSNNATTDTTTDANKISTSTTVYAETLQVTKLNGTLQKLQQPFVSVAQQVLSSQSKFYNPIHGEGVMSLHGMAPPVVPRLYK
jgi:hypothetical protein